MFKSFLLFSWLGVLSHGGEPTQYLVTISSTAVTISGNTNINRFVCDLERQEVRDSLQIISYYEADTLSFEGLRLSFPINEFDCGMAVINHDFQDFLMEEIYPEMYIDIGHMVIKREGSIMGKVSVVSEVGIELCGKEKSFVLPRGYVIELPENEIKLVSEENVRFTDFGLLPPTRLFGSIKVLDELSIAIEIALQVEALN
jgi:hypothetical protein